MQKRTASTAIITIEVNHQTIVYNSNEIHFIFNFMWIHEIGWLLQKFSRIEWILSSYEIRSFFTSLFLFFFNCYRFTHNLERKYNNSGSDFLKIRCRITADSAENICRELPKSKISFVLPGQRAEAHSRALGGVTSNFCQRKSQFCCVSQVHRNGIFWFLDANFFSIAKSPEENILKIKFQFFWFVEKMLVCWVIVDWGTWLCWSVTDFPVMISRCKIANVNNL